MSIGTLKDEILKLSEAEQAALRAWLMHQDWDDWDREMAEDFTPAVRASGSSPKSTTRSMPAILRLYANGAKCRSMAIEASLVR